MIESQLIIQPEKFGSKLEREFVNKMFHLRQYLKRLEKEDRLQFGTEYSVKTRKGEELLVKVVQYESPSTASNQLPNTMIELIAHTVDGIVVGNNHIELLHPSDSTALQASADIMTGVRGGGVGRPMMLVYFDIMQRKANEFCVPVKLVEEDAHAKDMVLLLENYKYTDNANDLELYNKRKEERKYWLALFKSGDLGYDYNLKKQIKPNYLRAQETLDTLSRVVLKSTVEDTMPIVQAEQLVDPSLSSEELYQARRASFFKVLDTTLEG